MEWSVVPASLRDNEKIQEKSQQADDGEFATRLGSDEEDLGSREVLSRTDQVVWYPAEVNTSIRPGWFFHDHENDQVKSVEHLMDLYERTVGGNTTFLLNLPPDRRGLIHENDARTMKELGERIHRTYSSNLADGAGIAASHTLSAEHGANVLTDGNSQTFWRPAEGVEQAAIELQWDEAQTFNRIMLKEYIRQGQRIEKFQIRLVK